MRTSFLLFQCLSITLLCTAANSARILGLFPLPAPSHYILGSALLRGLADKGHDVTMISAFGEKNPPKNYHDIYLSDLADAFAEKRKSMNMFELSDANPILSMTFFTIDMLNATDATLGSKLVQDLIKSNAKFDVVIVEQFMNEAHKALASHFKAPLVSVSTLGANYWVNSIIGNPSPPSYISDVFLNYPSNMSFCQRLGNTLARLYTDLLYHFYVLPQHNKIIKKHFPNPPELDEIRYNSSIVLMNSHPSTNQAVPYVPAMIDIGGYHIKPPQKLPEDLQKYLDGSPEGVVYFSMGSNLKSAQLPVEKRNAIIETFKKLKQKVIWKWEDETLEGKPKNVKISKWLPQQDILAHKNVKLFITHGGLLSTTETVYHGVPVLAIPIFGDQKLNAERIVQQGYGLELPFKELNEKTFSEKVNELLMNPKYAQNAKQKSVIFHDRPVKPMDVATYWVEYVIRHNGAPHLRVEGNYLPWWKYHLVDVIAFVTFVVTASALIGWILIKKLICRFFCKKETKIEKKKLKKQ